ncbi:MFS general substrate transporter [Hyaloscypha variabilis F]|uniref:MFS general substrate transporter n=1 Tax=Hyaloscypha variabilis (strain UAMH 11265 / GT02V1 / F) TaxID=1149755 RepID=A0A2J6RNF9_HYAVF|nr:MFS general substrate transporter [Hyaloscypha variabilis F]
MDFQRTKSTFELAGRGFPRVTWYKQRGMRGLYVCLLFVVLTSATNGYDGSMMNGLQSLPQWEHYYHNPSPSQLGLLNCIMSVGSICAIPFVPYTADILGRRTGVMIGCTIMCRILGVVLQTLGFTYGMFVGARFFIGFGVAIAHGASPLLITELVHPQHRAIYTTIYNTTWYIGSLVAAWLTFGTNKIQGNWAWRAPSLVQVFPSALQMIFIWFVPESPRWLISKGESEQALRVLANAHAQGNEQDEVAIHEKAHSNSDNDVDNLKDCIDEQLLLFLVATAGMLVSFVVWTICSARFAISGSKAAADIVVLMIFVFYVFYNTAWSGLLVGYGVEILPYNIRAKICYCVWLVFELFIVWKFHIETRNTPLEEIVKHFDGEGAIIGGDAAYEKSRQ